MARGDCFTCARTATCTKTNAKKISQSFTCLLFEGVPEPVYLARLDMMQKYGEAAVIDALLAARPPEQEDGEKDDE